MFLYLSVCLLCIIYIYIYYTKWVFLKIGYPKFNGLQQHFPIFSLFTLPLYGCPPFFDTPSFILLVMCTRISNSSHHLRILLLYGSFHKWPIHTDPQNVWILDFMENPISKNGNTADFGATPRSFVTGVVCFTMAAAWSKKSQQPSSPRLLSSGSFRTNVPTIS